MKKPTINDLKQHKIDGTKFKMITVYDHQIASIVNRTNIDMILVGDSLGMIIKGEEGTNGVTIDEIQYHLKCV